MPGRTPSLGTSISAVSAEPPKRAQIDRQHDMARSTKRRGDATRGGKLDQMALVVVHRQRQHVEPGLAREAGGDHRIEPAGQQDDGARLDIGFGHVSR